MNKTSIITVAGIVGLCMSKKFVGGSLSSNINVFDIDQYKKEMTTHLKNKFEQANQDIKSGKVSGVEITGDSTKLANIFSEKSIDA